MSTSFSECEGITSLTGTWIDFFERDASSTFETMAGGRGTHVD